MQIQLKRLILILALTACGCAGVSIPADLDSGISGIVLAGPTCPVEMPDDPDCDDQPYAATVIVKTLDGSSTVTRFTAGNDGRFRVPLFPGTYRLDPLPGANGFPISSPQTVVVQSDSYTEVTISYDTGIR